MTGSKIFAYLSSVFEVPGWGAPVPGLKLAPLQLNSRRVFENNTDLGCSRITG